MTASASSEKDQMKTIDKLRRQSLTEGRCRGNLHEADINRGRYLGSSFVSPACFVCLLLPRVDGLGVVGVHALIKDRVKKKIEY